MGLPVAKLPLGVDFVPNGLSPETTKALLEAKDAALDARRNTAASHPFRALLNRFTFEY